MNFGHYNLTNQMNLFLEKLIASSLYKTSAGLNVDIVTVLVHFR